MIRKRRMNIREWLPAILWGVYFLPNACFIRKVHPSIYRAQPTRIDTVDFCLGKLEDAHEQLLEDRFLPHLSKLRFDKTKHPSLLLNDIGDSRLPDEKYLVCIYSLVALCEVLGGLRRPHRGNETTVKEKNNVISMSIYSEGLEEIVQDFLR